MIYVPPGDLVFDWSSNREYIEPKGSSIKFTWGPSKISEISLSVYSGEYSVKFVYSGSEPVEVR